MGYGTVLSAATTSDGDRLRISPLLTPAVPESSFHLRRSVCLPSAEVPADSDSINMHEDLSLVFSLLSIQTFLLGLRLLKSDNNHFVPIWIVRNPIVRVISSHPNYYLCDNVRTRSCLSLYRCCIYTHICAIIID